MSLSPNGSPINLRISPYATVYIRDRATDLMNAKVRINKPVPAYDPATRTTTNTEGPVKYEGPCRIWEVPGGNQIVIGDEEFVITQSYMSIPWNVSPLPEVDDLIIVVDSDDADLIGRSINIESAVRGGGLRASRKFEISISTSKKDTW
jgi:hypothetical protein